MAWIKQAEGWKTKPALSYQDLENIAFENSATQSVYSFLYQAPWVDQEIARIMAQYEEYDDVMHDLRITFKEWMTAHIPTGIADPYAMILQNVIEEDVRWHEITSPLLSFYQLRKADEEEAAQEEQ